MVLTSRSQAQADEVVQQLKQELGEEADVWGVACDVSVAADVAALQQQAIESMGRVSWSPQHYERP